MTVGAVFPSLEQKADSKIRSLLALQSLEASSKIMNYRQASSEPFRLIFTVSPSWISRIGTVALAVARNKEGAGKTRIASRDEGSWRPSSIFGGMFTSVVTQEVPVIVDGEVTLKARISSDSPAISSTSRLSTLFTDWMVPASGGDESSSVKSKVGAPSELVGEVPERFATISRSIRREGLVGLGIDDDSSDIVNLQLESLMVRSSYRLRASSSVDLLCFVERPWNERSSERSNDEAR
jgi:hypothetical protein